MEKVKAVLKSFVDAGGKVENLTRNDYEYRVVFNKDVYDANGRRLTMEEKFALAGYPRAKKQSTTNELEERFKKEVSEYIASGGRFDIPKKQLPFFDLSHNLIRHLQRETGIKMTVEQLYEKYGFGDNYVVDKYPEYTKYARLTTLANYKDSSGFVDSYRKDYKFKNYVAFCADCLDMPVSVVVGLVANQKLRRYSYSGNVLNLTAKMLEDYKEEHGSFKSISENDPILYERLTSLRKLGLGTDMAKISTEDIVEFLQVELVDNDFKPVEDNYVIDEAKLLESLREKAINNGGTLYRADIPKAQYMDLLKTAKKYGVYPVDFLKNAGIDYFGGRRIDSFTRMWVVEYPYLDEMRAERDKLVAQNNNIDNVSEEEAFTIYLNICKDVYGKYKDKISAYSESNDDTYDA